MVTCFSSGDVLHPIAALYLTVLPSWGGISQLGDLLGWQDTALCFPGEGAPEVEEGLPWEEKL